MLFEENSIENYVWYFLHFIFFILIPSDLSKIEAIKQVNKKKILKFRVKIILE